MNSNYEFDAPQYLNLESPNESTLETYFDIKTNVVDTRIMGNMEIKETARHVTFDESDKENVAKQEQNPDKYSLGQFGNTPMVQKTRQSEASLLNRFENLNIAGKHPPNHEKRASRIPLRSSQIFEGIALTPATDKKHKMVTRNDAVLRTPRLSLRNRSVPRLVDVENDVSTDETDESMMSAVSTFNVPTSDCFKRPSCEPTATLQPTKFIALAEQVARFQRETPDRFRTKPHRPWKPTATQPTACVPKSPRLTAVHRNRPVQALTQEQKEEKIVEEMLSYQYKARPVNKKILEGVQLGLKAPIEKKELTRPEPFRITQVEKTKFVPNNETPYKFKAQPVPKKILQSPVGIPAKNPIPVTTPQTPNITRPRKVAATPVSVASSKSTELLPTKTTLAPFSFDIRDKLSKMRKEEQIKKIIEEEKKAHSSFKANPLRPLHKMTPMKPLTDHKKTIPEPFNLTQLKEKKEPEVKMELFKARPAEILKKAPFFPTYSEVKVPKVEPFDLRTAKRVDAWQKFEEKLKVEAEAYRISRMKEEEEKERLLKEEVKLLRKQAEFKATPAPRK